jgi:PAS domain S-box-containing protein
MSEAIDPILLGEAILSSPADAVIATDVEGHIQPERAIGQPLDIIIPERLRERHWSGFRKVMARGQSRCGQGDVLSIPGLREGGQTISLEFTIIPVRGSRGELLRIAAILRDVTRRFEELRALRQQLAQAARDSSGQRG